jgi:hypothetical protein
MITKGKKDKQRIGFNVRKNEKGKAYVNCAASKIVLPQVTA